MKSGSTRRLCGVLGLGIFFGFGTGLGAPEDNGFDRLYKVLHQYRIPFETNALFSAGVEGAIKKIDPGARMLARHEASLLGNGETILKREEWAEGIGYLKLSGLFEKGRKEVLECLRKWTSEGRHGVLLDLRGASGHDLDFVDELSGFFLPDRTNLYQIVTGTGEVLETRYTRKADSPGKPAAILIILLDGSTAGASELLAAVLQNAGGVLIVGSRTAGDNALREPIPFLGDKLIYIATRRVVLINGQSYNRGNGVTPDILVPPGVRRQPVLNPISPRYGRTPSEKAKRGLQVMQRVSEDPALERAVDILLALIALEYHDSKTTTNSTNASRL